jgi:hypothetical protein
VLQAKDVDKDQQLKALKAQKPLPLAKIKAWKTAYIPITLTDYVDFGQRTALCLAAFGVGRRLQEDASGDAPGNASPAVAGDGARLLPLLSAEPAALQLTVNGTEAAAAPPGTDDAAITAMLSNPLFKDFASVITQRAQETTADAVAAQVRTDALARLSAALVAPPAPRALGAAPRVPIAELAAAAGRGAPLAPAATPSVANPIVIAAGCQPLVDWVAAKVDTVVATLLPLAVEQIKPLLDLFTSLTNFVVDVLRAVNTLVTPTYWTEFLNDCGVAVLRAWSDGNCNDDCLNLLTPPYQTLSAVGKAATGMKASADGLLETAELIAYFMDDLRTRFCDVTRALSDTEFRKLSLYSLMASALKSKSMTVQVTGREAWAGAAWGCAGLLAQRQGAVHGGAAG